MGACRLRNFTGKVVNNLGAITVAPAYHHALPCRLGWGGSHQETLESILCSTQNSRETVGHNRNNITPAETAPAIIMARPIMRRSSSDLAKSKVFRNRLNSSAKNIDFQSLDSHQGRMLHFLVFCGLLSGSKAGTDDRVASLRNCNVTLLSTFAQRNDAIFPRRTTGLPFLLAAQIELR